MAGSRFVSRGTALFAVISTLNLLIIMAAIANDDSSSSTPSSLMVTTIVQTPALTAAMDSSVPTPSIASLVRGPEYESVIKVAGAKDLSTPTNLSSFAFKENSTKSSLDGGDTSAGPFTTQNWTEVRAQHRSNALLPCHVRNSGDGVTVSWIRRKDYHLKKDYHLLTIGLQTYSSDDRFQVIHSHSPDDWTLKIKYVQPRDAEYSYECQVSTHPPSSIFVTLNVVESRAEIFGGPEKIYKAGSTVELKCDLIDSTEDSEYIWWFRGQQMINYDPVRHINVTHYKSSSVLVLQNVQKADTGNYSCVPSNAHPSSIFVHIINGENPAAMQHGSHSTSCVPCPPLWFLSFLLSLTLQALYLRFMTSHISHVDIMKTENLVIEVRKSPNTTLISPQTSPSDKFSHRNHEVEQCHEQSHHCQFLHNYHLQASTEGIITTTSCHKCSKNDDHNHPHKIENEDDDDMDRRGVSGEQDPIFSASFSCENSNSTSAIECNQTSGARSSNFVLCTIMSQDRGETDGSLPKTAHSPNKLTVR